MFELSVLFQVLLIIFDCSDAGWTLCWRRRTADVNSVRRLTAEKKQGSGDSSLFVSVHLVLRPEKSFSTVYSDEF